MTNSLDEDALDETILRKVAERGAGKTICPSEVARALGGPDQSVWRQLMQPMRRAAIRLAEAERVAILRKGKPVADLANFKGIYRIGPPRGPVD